MAYGKMRNPKHPKMEAMDTEYASNAGYSEAEGVKRIAETHGAGMKFGKNDIGEVVSTAHTQHWGPTPAYAEAVEQKSNGSMDYMAVKSETFRKDAGRVNKDKMGYDGKGPM